MKDKTNITYWLQLPGEENEGLEIYIMSTEMSKVPSAGEVINFDTRFEKEWAESVFSHLSEQQKKSFFPREESQIKGDFVVVSVKRYIKVKYYSEEASRVFSNISIGSNGTSMISPKIPVSYNIECFEVFVQPFRNTELTETPIARVRNLLGPLFGIIDMLNLIAEHPEKEKELLELFKGNIKSTKESIMKLREIIGNDENWK